MMTKGTLAQIAALPSLPIAELKDMWRTYFGSAPPAYNRRYLESRLAYRLQELAYGELSEAARVRMTAILQAVGADELASPKAKPKRKRRKPDAVAGTRFVREWRGERHEVTVVADGFEYRGQRYRSLSVIARTITGTQWSGPAFFGLRDGRAS